MEGESFSVERESFEERKAVPTDESWAVAVKPVRGSDCSWQGATSMWGEELKGLGFPQQHSTGLGSQISSSLNHHHQNSHQQTSCPILLLTAVRTLPQSTSSAI